MTKIATTSVLIVSIFLVNTFVPHTRASDLNIYTDSLTSLWQEASWGAISKDLASNEQVATGSKSIKISLSAWGALRLRSGPWGFPTNISSTDYAGLTMQVHGGATGGVVLLKLENDSAQTFPTKTFNLNANTWNTVSGTMLELNPSAQTIHGFYLQEYNGQAKTYYIDDVKLTAIDGSSVVAPAPESDTTLPSVYLSTPAPGTTVSGNVTIVATANDNVGVVGVQFKINDENIGGEDTSEPFSILWNSAVSANGEHNINVIARDAAGNVGTVSIGVTVNNIISSSTSVTDPALTANGSLWVSAYLPSWEFNTGLGDGNWGSYTVEEIDWDAFTHLILFATGLDGNGVCCQVTANGNWNDNRLKKIVAAAHAQGKPILFSLGGAGSGGWNSALSNSATRAIAVNNLVNFMNQYQFDGIDLDPEEGTISGAANSWDDFIEVFAQELRIKLNSQSAYYDVTKKPILTAAIFNNFNDWARAEPYLDQINIMSYDQTGTWLGETWHNNAAQNVKTADGSCATADISEHNGNTCMATIESDIDDLIELGVPKSKIGGGIDFNGWVWRGGTKLNDSGSAPLTPRDRWGVSPIMVSVGTTSANSDCNLRSSVESRYYNLKKCYLEKYPSSIKWDPLSNVSYFALDNPGTADDIYITFQDTKSVTYAVNYIKSKGVGGMILWEIGGGYLGKNNFTTYSGVRDELLQAVKVAVGSTNFVVIPEPAPIIVTEPTSDEPVTTTPSIPNSTEPTTANPSNSGSTAGGSGSSSSGSVSLNPQANLSTSTATVVEEKSLSEAQVVVLYNQFVNLDSAGRSVFDRIVPKDSSLEINKLYSIAYFLQYGTTNTQWLGLGERAGVIDSFNSAFGRLPQDEADWQDIIKIANGRWPSRLNIAREARVVDSFKKIYLRLPDRKNPRDDAAITIMAYGLRNPNRNLNSEKVAIKYFRAIYGRVPTSASDWDIMRAIAYSGAIR